MKNYKKFTKAVTSNFLVKILLQQKIILFCLHIYDVEKVFQAVSEIKILVVPHLLVENSTKIETIREFFDPYHHYSISVMKIVSSLYLCVLSCSIEYVL